MTRLVRSALWWAAVLGAIVGPFAPAFATTVSFLDNMDNAGQAGQYQTFTSGTGEATATVPTSGGNPGAYTNLSLNLDVNEGVNIARLWNLASFNPSVSGAVSSVVAGYDIRRTFSNDPGATQVARWVAILQGGVLHLEFYGVTTNTDWEHFTSGNLVTDVPEVNWTNGSEILFGFANSAFAGLGIPFVIDGGYDNFSVNLDFTPPSGQVPEPATLVLLVSGLAGLATVAARKTRTN